MWNKIAGRPAESDSRAGGSSTSRKSKDKDKERDDRPVMSVRRRTSEKGDKSKRSKSRREQEGKAEDDEEEWDSEEEEDQDRNGGRSYSYPADDLESVNSHAVSRKSEKERAHRRDTGDDYHESSKKDDRKRREKDQDSDSAKRKKSKDGTSSGKSPSKHRSSTIVDEPVSSSSRAIENVPPYGYGGNVAPGAGLSNVPPLPYTPESHVNAQFPGQIPVDYSHPSIPMTGAAAEYYNDTGPSMNAGQSQPYQNPVSTSGLPKNVQGSNVFYAHPDTVNQQASSERVDKHSSKPTRISSSSSARHGNQHHTSNSSANALGAAAVATGAYALQNQSSHNDHRHSSHAPHHKTSSMDMRSRHESKSAVGNFVDWWRNYEDVRKMEMYTEAIGVCKYCFDPDSSIVDAPRKHHYHARSKRSTDSLRRTAERQRRTGRVDKESRYAPSYYSDEERRKGSKKGLLAAGVAGYGLAKVARDVRKRDTEDDMVGNGSRRRKHRSRSRSRDRHSITSRGVIKDSHGAENVSVVADSHGGYRVEKRRKKRRSSAGSSSSSSSSGSSISSRRSRKNGFFSTGLFGAAAASVLGSRSRRSRSRSRSPSKRHDRKHRRRSSRSPERQEIRRRSSNVSRGSHDSRHRTSTNAGTVAGAGLLGGLLGSTFGDSSSNRQERSFKSKSKKSGGFFSFGSASSSSSDDHKSRRDSKHDRDDKRKKSKGKLTDDEKINATLLGLGATAAAITAAQAGRRHGKSSKPELVAAKHRRNDRSRGIGPSKHNADDEGWESASDGAYSDSSAESFETGLAYGDSIYKGKGARKSTDSLASDRSGTWKWGWRWGNRDKKKRKSTESLNSGMMTTAAGALVGAGAASAASAYYNQNNGHQATGSHAPMQEVWPISTADPNSFDVRRSDSMSQPIYTSRPGESFTIQAPQPVVPVSSAYYTQPSPAYTTPTGPPVDFTQAFASQTKEPQQVESDRENRRKKRDPEPGIRRRDSSPAKLGRDAALVGGAAAAMGATAAILSRKKSNVSFDLEQENAYRRERDERRREKRSSTSGPKRDSEREREARDRNAKVEQERVEREARQREEEEARKVDAEREARLARLDKERERKDRERKEAREARGLERRARRREEEELESDGRPSRVTEPEDRRSREQESSSRTENIVAGAAAAAMAGSVIAAMKSSKSKDREAENFEEEVSSTRDLRKSKPVAYDSRNSVPSSTAMAASTNPSYKEEIRRQQHEDLHDTNTEEPSYRDIVAPTTVEPSYVDVAPSGVEIDTFDDDFDPDYFKKKFARKAAAIVVSSPSSEKEMFTELQDRYEHSTVDAGTFFAPKELTEEHDAYVPKGPNADVNIEVFNAVTAPRSIDTSRSKGRSSTVDSNGRMMPWPVPSLKLIEPTPPGTRSTSPVPAAETDKSTARSVPEVKPESKSVDSDDENTRSRPVTRDGDSGKPAQRSQSKVRWGTDETIHYEVVTPLPSTVREKSSFIGDDDLAASQGLDEIVVEEEDDRGKRKARKHKYDVEDDDSQRRRSSRKEDSPEEDYDERRRSSRKDSGPVYRPVSPERTPVVVQPQDVQEQMDSSPFYENVSDLNQPAKQHGYVEGEVFDETPDIQRQMPGGFDDEPDEPRKPKSSKKSKKSSARDMSEDSQKSVPPVNVFDYLEQDPTPDDPVTARKAKSGAAADYFSQRSGGELTEEPQELDKVLEPSTSREQPDEDEDLASSTHTESTTTASRSDKSEAKRKSKSSKNKKDEEEKRPESKKEARKKSKRKNTADEIVETPTIAENRERDMPPRDDAQERKEARRAKREEINDENDDDDTRSVKSERREKRRSKHEDADDFDDARSTKSERKEKRSSKHEDLDDFDDTRSVASTVRSGGSKRSKDKDKDKENDKSRSGIFGLLSRTRSDETIKSAKSRSTEADEDEDDRDRRRRKKDRDRDRERDEDDEDEPEPASKRRGVKDESDDDRDSRASSKRDSKSSKRESKKEKRKSKDQESFLAERAEDVEDESEPLPVKSLVEDSIAAVVTAAGVGHLVDKHDTDVKRQHQDRELSRRSSEAVWERGTDTDIADIAALQTLPESDSNSPCNDSPRTPPPPSLVEQRASSTTKIPLRWRNSVSSPVRSLHEDIGPSSPSNRSRHSRTGSTDGKFTGKAPRPLVLVESSRENSPISAHGRRNSWGSGSGPPTSARPLVFPSPQLRHSRSNSRDIPTGDEFRPYFLLEKLRQSPVKDESFPELPSSREESRSPKTRSRSASDVRVPEVSSLDTEALNAHRSREFYGVEATRDSQSHSDSDHHRLSGPDSFRTPKSSHDKEEATDPFISKDAHESVRAEPRQASSDDDRAVDVTDAAIAAGLGGAALVAASKLRGKSDEAERSDDSTREAEARNVEDDDVIEPAKSQQAKKEKKRSKKELRKEKKKDKKVFELEDEPKIASDDETAVEKAGELDYQLDPSDAVETLSSSTEPKVDEGPNLDEHKKSKAGEVLQRGLDASETTQHESVTEPDKEDWSEPVKTKGKKSKKKRQSMESEILDESPAVSKHADRTITDVPAIDEPQLKSTEKEEQPIEWTMPKSQSKKDKKKKRKSVTWEEPEATSRSFAALESDEPTSDVPSKPDNSQKDIDDRSEQIVEQSAQDDTEKAEEDKWLEQPKAKGKNGKKKRQVFTLDTPDPELEPKVESIIQKDERDSVAEVERSAILNESVAHSARHGNEESAVIEKATHSPETGIAEDDSQDISTTMAQDEESMPAPELAGENGRKLTKAERKKAKKNRKSGSFDKVEIEQDTIQQDATPEDDTSMAIEEASAAHTTVNETGELRIDTTAEHEGQHQSFESIMQQVEALPKDTKEELPLSKSTARSVSPSRALNDSDVPIEAKIEDVEHSAAETKEETEDLLNASAKSSNKKSKKKKKQVFDLNDDETGQLQTIERNQTADAETKDQSGGPVLLMKREASPDRLAANLQGEEEVENTDEWALSSKSKKKKDKKKKKQVFELNEEDVDQAQNTEEIIAPGAEIKDQLDSSTVLAKREASPDRLAATLQGDEEVGDMDEWALSAKSKKKKDKKKKRQSLIQEESANEKVVESVSPIEQSVEPSKPRLLASDLVENRASQILHEALGHNETSDTTRSPARYPADSADILSRSAESKDREVVPDESDGSLGERSEEKVASISQSQSYVERQTPAITEHLAAADPSLDDSPELNQTIDQAIERDVQEEDDFTPAASSGKKNKGKESKKKQVFSLADDRPTSEAREAEVFPPQDTELPQISGTEKNTDIKYDIETPAEEKSGRTEEKANKSLDSTIKSRDKLQAEQSSNTPASIASSNSPIWDTSRGFGNDNVAEDENHASIDSATLDFADVLGVSASSTTDEGFQVSSKKKGKKGKKRGSLSSTPALPIERSVDSVDSIDAWIEEEPTEAIQISKSSVSKTIGTSDPVFEKVIKPATPKTRSVNELDNTVVQDATNDSVQHPPLLETLDSSSDAQQVPVLLANEAEEFSWSTTSKKKGKKSKKAGQREAFEPETSIIKSETTTDPREDSSASRDTDQPTTALSKKDKKKAKKLVAALAATAIASTVAGSKSKKGSRSDFGPIDKEIEKADIDVSKIALPSPTLEEDEDLQEHSHVDHHDRDFNDTIATGLRNTGFDQDIILKDLELSRTTSRNTVLEEPDFDDFPEHASRKSSRRGSKRLSQSHSMERSVVPDHSTSGHTLDEDEFSAVLAAGLVGSGFHSPPLFDPKRTEASRELHDEAEITGLRTGTKLGWGSTRGSNESLRSKSSLSPKASANSALHVDEGVPSLSRRPSIKRGPPEEFVDQGSSMKRKIEDATTTSNESAETERNVTRDVLESTWSFPPNRDSAIVMNDPYETPIIPAPRDTTRDSGFPETPVLPEETIKSSADTFEQSPRKYRGSPAQHHGPQSPILVQVEASQDWDVMVTPERKSKRRSSSPELPGGNIPQTPKTISKGYTSPPAVESTTRDRSNAVLFQSSPSTRETHHQFQQQSPPTSEPRIEHRSTRVPASNIEALAKKRSRRSVGVPDSEERSTSEAKSSRRVVSTPAAGLNIITSGHSPQRALSPDSHVSIDDMIAQKSWPSVDDDRETIGLDSVLTGANLPPISRSRRLSSHQRSPSIASESSLGHPARIRSPLAQYDRSMSPASAVSSSHPLRRIDRSRSGDLRSASRMSGDSTSPRQPSTTTINNNNINNPDTQVNAGLIVAGVGAAALATAAFAARSPAGRNRGIGRAVDMDGVYEGVGDLPASPRSPTRPHSLRKRQSLQIVDLESRVNQLAQENRQLQDARNRLERTSRDLTGDRESYVLAVRNATDALAQRDEQIRQKDEQIREIQENMSNLQSEIDRLAQENAHLTEQNHGIVNERVVDLQKDHDATHGKWQEALLVIASLKAQQKSMSDGMENMVKDEIAKATTDQEREIERLQTELNESMEQTRLLQQQILGLRQDYVVERDEDYFEGACTQLCQHVQQWVLRYSKFSDTKACRLSSEVKDDKLEARLDDAILDGSDVDALLNDRVKRRDVFMSLVMSMVWEYIFTRYLFGLDQGQRSKLKSIEKQLTEIGPRKAVAQWRVITLTLLSRREAFQTQRAQDTEAVVLEIMATLSRLVSPPSHLKQQIIESLRKVMTLAVDLSIEMRTQRAEYIMLAPLRPEYDTNGDLVAKVTFNADLMNERSGETSSNTDLEAQGAHVKIVLFPLVVKKGDDNGDGEDEVIVCPAQVLVAKVNKGKKVVRVMSGAMDVDTRESSTHVPEEEEGVPF